MRRLLVISVAGRRAGHRGAVELDGTAHLTITNVPLSTGSDTRTVAPAGDVNGGGLGDIVIGTSSASRSEDDARPSGEVLVVFGRRECATVDARTSAPRA